MNNHATLLNELGTSLGDDLTLDENGQCFIMLDGRLMISIRSLENRFMLYGMLGVFPEDGATAGFWRHLMSQNFALMLADTGILAVDEGSDAVVLLKSIPDAKMTIYALQNDIAMFATQMEKLIKYIDGGEIVQDEGLPNFV
jgi:hypothetical protein